MSSKWLAIGTGIGIEIAGDDLRLVAAKVRPNGITVLSAAVIEKFTSRQASEWGSEFATFLKRCGSAHLAATVLLPRPQVILRQLTLPGVKDDDLASAIGFQLDSLHPYPEDDVICDWARAGKSNHIIVGIAKREVIDKYSNLFAEAGIQVKSFSTTAATMFTARRVFGAQPAGDMLALHARDGEMEAYGESVSNPTFSGLFDASNDAIASRAIALSLAELRLPPETEAVSFERALPPPSKIDAEIPLAVFAPAYAAALHSAVTRNGLNINLLPPEKRQKDSKLVYIPTAVLGTALAGLLLSLLFYDKYEERRYADGIKEEIKKVQPAANRADNLDKTAENARARIVLLDNYRKRSAQDLDVLNELTRLLPPPVWVNSFDLNRTTVFVSGEADQAAPLLKVLDQSPLFVNSDFTMPLARNAQAELFRIRTNREPGK